MWRKLGPDKPITFSPRNGMDNAIWSEEIVIHVIIMDGNTFSFLER